LLNVALADDHAYGHIIIESQHLLRGIFEDPTMPFHVPLEQAKKDYPQYTFITALTPSEQKAAFYVKDEQGRDLCLKIIAPDYNIDRLNREILALQSINHPNVASLIEYMLSSKEGVQRHYLVEEFIVGQDLAEQIHPGQQWSLAAASKFFSALCDGLAELNRLNIVHRDLKPSNIRVRPDGSPVIIDFGLARHLNLPDLTRTEEGAAIGTPLYFSPEQFSGTKHDIDHRTDLFAIGILLYQVLTGHHPFYCDEVTPNQLCTNVCESDTHFQRPEFLSLQNSWQIILRRLLEKQRAKRPRDASQVASILRKIGAS
jgi:serine/threonine protein kinase